MRNAQKIKVGLVQINNSYANHNYLPYSVGLIQAYAQTYLSEQNKFEFILPLYKRMPISFAIEKLSGADVIFFSAYVWNMQISLEIAERYKLANPDVLIVFGGPHVPSKTPGDFLSANPFIDILGHAEAEITGYEILRNFEKRSWENVASISYLDPEGKLIQTPNGNRVKELDKVPSPYLSGVFEPLMEENPENVWLGLWETNRGCPFSCSFCDWGSLVQSKVYTFDLDRLYQEIDWFSKKKIEFIFCCDANFGILPRDVEIVKYFAENKMKHGYPKVFSVQNTKNSTQRTYTVEKIMADAGLNKGVALAFQSLNKDTLKHSKRGNISIKNFQELQQKFAIDEIETFTDLILGLPLETYESYVEGISITIDNGQHNRIQFNNLSILPNAEMGDPEYQKKYGFVIVEIKAINAHGSLNDKEEVYETQKLVIGTDSMPKDDWRRARAVSWMTALLHFDKLLQIPFVILHQNYSIKYRDLIEGFSNVDASYPVLFGIRKFFEDKALDIQKGGSEFCESKEWLNLMWPSDELVLINLCTENKLGAFYEEAESLLGELLQMRGETSYKKVLHDAISLNKSLIKLPFQEKDLDVILSFNVWELYDAVLKGRSVPLRQGEFHHTVYRKSLKWSSWEDWCREVIWFGNKKGAYLYKLGLDQSILSYK